MNKHLPPHRPITQRGVSLLFALIALVVLMMGSLALVRNVDIASQLLGNLGQKQDATASTDVAVRQAVKWITSNGSSLNSDMPADGYYASNQEFNVDGVTAKDPIDTTGEQLKGTPLRQLIDWDNNNCSSVSSADYSSCAIKPKVLGDPVNGNTASYVILRLCNRSGDPHADQTIKCAKPLSGGTAQSNTHNSLASGEIAYPGSSLNYFRILVRVVGARNASSVTETIVHF